MDMDLVAQLALFSELMSREQNTPFQEREKNASTRFQLRTQYMIPNLVLNSTKSKIKNK